MSTWQEALRGAVERGRSQFGMTQDGMAEELGVSRQSFSRAINTGKGIGWDIAVALAKLVKLDGVAKTDFLYAFLETKTSRQDEGAVFIRNIQRLAKKMPRGEMPLFREQVVQAYAEAMQEKREAEEARRRGKE